MLRRQTLSLHERPSKRDAEVHTGGKVAKTRACRFLTALNCPKWDAWPSFDHLPQYRRSTGGGAGLGNSVSTATNKAGTPIKAGSEVGRPGSGCGGPGPEGAAGERRRAQPCFARTGANQGGKSGETIQTSPPDGRLRAARWPFSCGEAESAGPKALSQAASGGSSDKV
jgi:hypothetical protein